MYFHEGEQTRTGPDGVDTLVQFDLGNRLEVIDRGPIDGSLVSADYTYYDNGLVQTKARGSGTVITYQYDAANRLTQTYHDFFFAPVILFYNQIDYTYYDNNLPATVHEWVDGYLQGFTTFTYDNRNRLISEVRTPRMVLGQVTMVSDPAMVYNRVLSKTLADRHDWWSVHASSGAIGFDRARQRKRGVPRLSGGLVKHLAKPLYGNNSYAMAA